MRGAAACLAVLICSMLLGGEAVAQRSRPSPAPPGQADRDTPEQFRARLVRVLELVEARGADLQSAIEALDGGASTDEAIEILGGVERARMLAAWLWEPRGDRRESDEARSHDGRPGRVSEEERGEVLAFLDEHVPELASSIREADEDRARMFERFMARLAPKVMEIRATEPQDSELASLMESELLVSLRVMDITRKLFGARREGNEDAVEKLRGELHAAAERMVDLRLQRREHEINGLLARAEKLREELDRQSGGRDELVADVVNGAMRPFDRGPQGDRRRGPDRDRDD